MTRRKGGDRHSDETAAAVRRDHVAGMTYDDIASKYGIGRNTVIKIVHHRHPYDVSFAVWKLRHQDTASLIAARVGRPPKYTVTNPDPLVRRLFQVMHAEGMTMSDVQRKSGVGLSSLQRWASGKRSPTAFVLDCALQACGYRLSVVRARAKDGQHVGRPRDPLPDSYTTAEVDAHHLGYQRGYADGQAGTYRPREKPPTGEDT